MGKPDPARVEYRINAHPRIGRAEPVSQSPGHLTIFQGYRRYKNRRLRTGRSGRSRTSFTSRLAGRNKSQSPRLQPDTLFAGLTRRDRIVEEGLCCRENTAMQLIKCIGEVFTDIFRMRYSRFVECYPSGGKPADKFKIRRTSTHKMVNHFVVIARSNNRVLIEMGLPNSASPSTRSMPSD